MCPGCHVLEEREREQFPGQGRALGMAASSGRFPSNAVTHAPSCFARQRPSRRRARTRCSRSESVGHLSLHVFPESEKVL